MKTYFATQKEIATKPTQWHIIDAKGVILGKLAVKVANILRGKDKPTFTAHLVMGDNVVVINAKDIKVTGNKMTDKMYYRHSGYFGNLKQWNFAAMLEKNPSFIIEQAVMGMLPKNKLRKEYLKNLKVYAGSEHPHTAQQPKELTI